MIDIKFLRENPEIVKENIRKKFQEQKLPLVDEVIALDAENRKAKQEGDDLRAARNKISKEIGVLMSQGKREEAEAKKAEVAAGAKRLAELEALEAELQEKITKIMMVIPNIIDSSVPIGKDDSENVEIQKYGEPVVPDFEVPYHADILESLSGLDKEAAGRTSGNGFYYLMGAAARIHSAMISYARDFMIDKGFTYCIPPFMIRSSVVNGVMSFAEMEAMMYKIEGEDLYLIGTSEHSMIGKFKGEMVPENQLPVTMTSYSPCFRKEVGSHGIEERGVYRVHQFEKQEMVVLCKPEDSMDWYNKMWSYTVEFFRSLDIPVRTLECCSGDLADLKVKSCDVEAWSPRQKKYFEVGSCSTLGDAQARRLGIRTKGENGTYYVHTLNNTVLASPRGLIAFLENNVNADGTVKIPEALRPYMGLGLFTGGLIWLISCFQFKDTAVEVPGTITEIIEYRDSDGEYHHRIYVAYEYNGEIFENISLDSYTSSMYEGDSVTLLCDPERPGKVKLASMLYFGPSLLIGMGALFAVVGGGILATALSGAAKRKKIKNQGKILYATVEQISYNKSYTVNGIHPYVIYCTYRDDYRDVVYRFKSENLWSDPSVLFPVGSSIEVRVDEKDYSKYYVNVEAMDKKFIDYT